MHRRWYPLVERLLHGWLSQQFERAQPNLELVARARPFCAFILMVGRIVSAEEFAPEAAILLQSRDEVVIPLLLETIPSAAEFRAATQSLSPEQLRFTQAFRSMQ